MLRFLKIEGRLGKIDDHIIQDTASDEALMQMLRKRDREHEERLAKMDKHMVLDLAEHASMRTEVAHNTSVTQSVKVDTAGIVQVALSLSALRRFLTWFIPLASGALALYITYIKG